MHSSTVRLSSFVNGSSSWFVWLLKGSLARGSSSVFVYIIMMVLSRLIRKGLVWYLMVQGLFRFHICYLQNI